MHESHQKENFSFAYFLAIAAKAKCNHTSFRVDNESVDVALAKNIEGCPRLEVQLKCTQNLNFDGMYYKFPLKIKNYNDLRNERLIVPKILVIVNVPVDVTEWISQDNEKLILKRCGYWMSLRGYREVSNASSVTISIPSSNIFSAEKLNVFMNNIANTCLI